MIKKIKAHYFNKHFIIFVIIGVINTFNCTLISYALTALLAMDANLAFVIGYVCSMFIAYILNSVFNFKQNMTPAAMLKFFVSYIPNFVIQNVIVFIVYNTLGLPELVAYAAAAIVGIPVTFIILKGFVFIKKSGSETEETKDD